MSIFYPAAGEARFDMTYYVDKHIPLVQRLLAGHGLQKLEVDEGLSGGAAGAPPNYRIVARLYFDAIESFQGAMATVGNELLGDVPNYTDIPLELQVSKTVSF